MCGIFLSCAPFGSAEETAAPAIWQATLPCLCRRGPDAHDATQVPIKTGLHRLLLGSSLLHLRGLEPPKCPIEHKSSGNFLAFNGEIFGGLAVQPGESDSKTLLNVLSQPGACIAKVISSIEGPFAFIFWHESSQTLWLARDAVGRRSLVIQKAGKTLLDGFLVSSIVTSSGCSPQAERPMSQIPSTTLQDSCDSSNWLEVEPGIFSLTFEEGYSTQGNKEWIAHEWENRTVLQNKEYERPLRLVHQSCTKEEQFAATKQVLNILGQAVKTHCNACDIDMPQEEAPSPGPAPVLILFSGGVDSTLIAALAHKALDEGQSIDLATVCFDEGKSPDRAAALDAVQELAVIAPNRVWRLIEINASLDDIDLHRSHILDLLRPAETVMDLNIGAALWLATKAEGPTQIFGPHGKRSALQSYKSLARIVLVGHGADEQCGGYGRHRKKFSQMGLEGLQAELKLDMQRLWLRNLGRDDRLIADHGRESRHPFLDEAFTAALLRLPLSAIVDMNLPAGQGDKRILRHMLRELGLGRAAARVKRAIQFGTKLAKVSNVREFGTNRGVLARHAGALSLDQSWR